MARRTPAVPEALARRPRTSSGLPVPFVAAERPDGSPDFTLIDPLRSLHASSRRLCAICGEALGYWLAFIGGPKSFDGRTFIDGPAHEECLLAATRLCPYLAQRATRRSTRASERGSASQGFDPAKPCEFAIGIARSYRSFVDHHGVVLHRSAPFVRLRRFRYIDDVLTEHDADENAK